MLICGRWLACCVLLVISAPWPAAARPARPAPPRACVVLDIDNTVADTRYRTLAAARAFARQHPEAKALAGLGVGQIAWNGRLTAQAAGLDAATAESFQRFWGEFFWRPSNFRHDRPIRETIARARQASAEGAEVFYLTGRVQALAAGTVRELLRLGLPDADAQHLLCKDSVAVRTDAFKGRELRRLRADGRHVVWFMSDAASELAAARASGVRGVLVDFPLRPPGDVAPSARTPRVRLAPR